MFLVFFQFRCLIEKCSAKFSSSQERHGHCVDCHAFPPNFRWVTPKVSKPKSSSKSGAFKEKNKLKQGVGVISSDKDNIPMDIDTSAKSNKSEASASKPIRGFVFGRGQAKKSFKSNGPDWHRRDGKVQAPSVLEESELSKDLMDTLPDITP